MIDSPPDFVNAEGVKWWRNQLLTDWARQPDRNGITLDAKAWVIEMPDGYRTCVLVSDQGHVMAENQTSEAMAVEIDVRKLLKHEDQATSEREG